MIRKIFLLLSSTLKLGAMSFSMFEVASLEHVLKRKKLLETRVNKNLLSLVLWYLIIGLVYSFYRYESVLYGLRPFQYLMVISLLKGGGFDFNFRFIKNVVFIHMLSFLLVPVKYFPFAYNWEVAVFYGAVLIYLLQNKGFSMVKVVILLLSVYFVIETDQKSVFLAIAGVLILQKRYRFIFLVLVLSFLPILMNSRLIDFLQTFDLTETWNAIKFGLAQVKNYTYFEFVVEQRKLLGNSGDLSFHLRLRKWIYAWSKMNSLNVFYGLGPGFFGGAADSSVLRVFFETGLIGFILLIKSIYSLNLFNIWLGMYLLLTSIFLDTLFSSTTLILVGVLCRKKS